MAENLKHLFSQGLGYGKGKPLPEPDVVIADYAPFECAVAANRMGIPAPKLDTLTKAQKNELFRSTYGGSRESLEAVLAQNYDSNGVAFEQSYRYPGKAVPVLLTVIAAVVILILIVAGV